MVAKKSWEYYQIEKYKERFQKEIEKKYYQSLIEKILMDKNLNNLENFISKLLEIEIFKDLSSYYQTPSGSERAKMININAIKKMLDVLFENDEVKEKISNLFKEHSGEFFVIEGKQKGQFIPGWKEGRLPKGYLLEISKEMLEFPYEKYPFI